MTSDQLKNYRPVFLLPICGEVNERLIFNDLFKYENDPISLHHLGFIPGDSCVQQFTSITHEIYKSLIGALLLKYEVYFWISQKSIKRFDMIDYYTNLDVTA